MLNGGGEDDDMKIFVVELQERQINRKNSSQTCHALSNIYKCVLMQVVINVM